MVVMALKPSVSIGDRFVNNQGSFFTIIDYKNAFEVTVRFDGDFNYMTTQTLGNIKKGFVKNPMYPSVLGVGFTGVGEYRSKIDGKDDPAYIMWMSMMIRCYCKEFQKRDVSYIGCSVGSHWHNYQNFAQWYYGHDNCNEGYQLDKDLLVRGNKVYGPKNCSLIPAQINALITEPRKKNNGLPVGVDFYKRRGLFRARVCIKGKSREIGFFKTAQQARLAYIKEKNIYIRLMADEWKDFITKDAYSSLVKRGMMND